jgi:site-specific recombinase
MLYFAGMALFKKDNQLLHLDEWAKELKATTDTNRYSALFTELVSLLRPGRKGNAIQNMRELLEALTTDKQLEAGLQQMFVYLFNTRDSQSIFVNAGILGSGTFFSELFRQIRHRILPPLPEKRSMNYLLEKAFHRKDDYKWVKEIPDESWITFFRIVSGGVQQSDSPLRQYLTNTLTILSYRVSYLGLEEELSSQLKAEIEASNPFLEQNKKIQSFIHLIRNGTHSEAYLQSGADDVMNQVTECERIINDIRDNTSRYGTSLGQSYLLLRTTQQLKRIIMIVQFLTPGVQVQQSLQHSVSLFKELIESINKRNSITDLYRKNSGMLAYQIAEHKSASGEHYITTTRSEYSAFFYSAAAGGVIIAFAALIKALLHKVHMAPFWQYFCYGLNYAIAFVTLFITGASLATKQPTMTAAALASSLDSRKGGVSFQGLALTFGKIWRSQFASFAGNLIVVFPLSYLLSVGWQYLTGDPLLHDKQEALQALRDQNPRESLAWLYACITGVCLFTSGIISGYVDNKVIYGNFGARLKEHSGLRKIYSGKTLSRMSDFMVRNLGGIIGNIALGFMLGYAKLIGDFFGIPFDIRHITISTAYFAFGVDSLGNHAGAYDWIWTTIGVIGIGFFNFLISFSLAFYVAVRSRNVGLEKLPLAGRMIWKYVRRFPQDFIYPPKDDRKEGDVFEK